MPSRVPPPVSPPRSPPAGRPGSGRPRVSLPGWARGRPAPLPVHLRRQRRRRAVRVGPADRRAPPGDRPPQRHAHGHAEPGRRHHLVVRRQRRRRVRHLADPAVRRRHGRRRRRRGRAGLSRRAGGGPHPGGDRPLDRRRQRAVAGAPRRAGPRRSTGTPTRPSVDALTRDDELLVISHSEHGDPRYPALRVLRTADTTEDEPAVVAEKWDGEGRGLHALEFGPLPGDRRLLVGHERRGREELLIWDVEAGTETELAPRPARRRDGRLLPGRVGAAGRARPRRPQRAVPLRPGHRGAGEAGHPARRRPRGDRPAGRHRGAGLVVVRAAAGDPPGRRAGRAVGGRRGAAGRLSGRGPLGARPGRGRARAAGPPRGARAVRDGVPGARRPGVGRRRLLPRPAGRLRGRRLRGRARQLPRAPRATAAPGGTRSPAGRGSPSSRTSAPSTTPWWPRASSTRTAR